MPVASGECPWQSANARGCWRMPVASAKSPRDLAKSRWHPANARVIWPKARGIRRKARVIWPKASGSRQKPVASGECQGDLAKSRWHPANARGIGRSPVASGECGWHPAIAKLRFVKAGDEDRDGGLDPRDPLAHRRGLRTSAIDSPSPQFLHGRAHIRNSGPASADRNSTRRNEPPWMGGSSFVIHRMVTE